MCSRKSLIYLSNGNAGAIVAGNTIPLGNIVRKEGSACTLSGDGVYLREAGYYVVDASATFGGTVGNVTVNVNQNGLKVASATESIVTAATEIHSVSIPSVVRVYCCAGSTITLTVDSGSTSTPTFTGVSLRIVKE